jgi:hypothetical protein
MDRRATVTGRANRNRGANAERAVANYMREHGWPNARRCLAGDGNQHTDIDGIPGVSIEVKDRTSSSWPAWRHQAITQALPGSIVVVVRRVRGVTDVGAWDAQIPWIDVEDHLNNSSLNGTFVMCPRTGTTWVRTAVADIVHHLNQDTP